MPTRRSTRQSRKNAQPSTPKKKQLGRIQKKAPPITPRKGEQTVNSFFATPSTSTNKEPKTHRSPRSPKKLHHLPLSPPSTPLKPKMTDEEQYTLHEFDFDWRFGPISGISRSRRYLRAVQTGVHQPPSKVMEIIHRIGSEADNSILSGYSL